MIRHPDTQPARNGLPPEVAKSFKSLPPKREPKPPAEPPPSPVPVKKSKTACPNCGGEPQPLVQITCGGKPCVPPFLKKRPRYPWHNFKFWFEYYLTYAGKVASYATWLLSPRVGEGELDERNEDCTQRCPFAKKTANGVFCPFCGCGERPEADVRNKNTRKAHNCPIGLHRGSTPEPAAYKQAANHWAKMRGFKPSQKGGCRKCGGG